MQTNTSHDHSTIVVIVPANAMVVVNRTRKDRCEKAHMLLLFVTHSRCRLRHNVTIKVPGILARRLATPLRHDQLCHAVSNASNILHRHGNQNL